MGSGSPTGINVDWGNEGSVPDVLFPCSTQPCFQFGLKAAISFYLQLFVDGGYHFWKLLAASHAR